jgi:hypothetical protein
MRHLLASAVLLLTACASHDAGVIHNQIEAGPGSPIAIRFGAQPGRETGIGGDIAVRVEVSNNSDADVVLDQVSVVQNFDANAVYRIDPAFQSVKAIIDPGKEQNVDLLLRGRQARPAEGGERPVIEVRVIAATQGGDSYYADFELPVPLRTR